MIWNQKRYVKLRLPIMRKAPLGEIHKSALTADMYYAARSKKGQTNAPSRLNKMMMKYEVAPTSGGWSLLKVGKNTTEEDSLVSDRS